MTVPTDILRQMASDPAAFRQHVMIDTDNGPLRVAEVLDDWQQKDFEALDPAWRRLIGQAVDSSIVRGWQERPRGHSKTSDLALQVIWALAFSPRIIRGVAAAADADQARLIRNSIESIVRVNRWLHGVIDVQRNAIENTRTKSRLDIITSDAKTSYGLLCDFVICDEVTHWANRDLWDSLLSTAAKRAHCLLLVITNAGFTGEWQYEVRQAVQDDPRWYFSALAGPHASWIGPEQLAEQAKLLPESSYRRLWENLWVDGAGDALSWHDVRACMTMPRFHPMPLAGFEYALALDLGRKRDHAALVALGIDHGRNKVAVAECLSWSPKDFEGNEISFRVIREACRTLMSKFKPLALIYDPWQAHLLSEDLAILGVDLVETTFTPANCSRMAQTLLMAFRRRQIELPDYGPLLQDLQKLRILERPAGGYKLDAERDERGHADRAIAMALGLPPCFDYIAETAFRGTTNEPTILVP